MCNENVTVGDRLGEVFVGEALNLVEHLTHSQGHLPCCPCLTAAVTILPVRLGLDAGNFEERFVGVTLSAPRWERIMGHLKHCSVSTRTRLSSSFLSGIFANLKISVEKTTGRDPFKSLISSPWEASFPGEAAMANWGDSKSFWKGEIDLFSLCYWAWKIFTSPICPSAEGL